MKRQFMQSFALIRSGMGYLNHRSTLYSGLWWPWLLFVWPDEAGPNSSRLFLIIIIVLIILLFLAVAVILPIALRLTRRQAKKPGPKPANQTAINLPDLPPLQATGPDTEPSLRPLGAEREPDTFPASGQRPANIGWQIAGLTDTGLRRELNEDNFLMVEAEMPCGLYAVADGMGGHDAGEVASQLIINALQEHFAQHPPTEPLAEWLEGAALAANEAVLAEQSDRTEDHKMGSTLVMALVIEGEAYIANVGDSRAYHLHHDMIEQISIDHSLVERLVQIGQLTREEARVHRQKNVIYNTVGDKPDMEVSHYHLSLQPDDRLLLCSDGLSGMITDEEILELSRKYAGPADACKAMIEAAKMAGGHDNITAIIVQLD